MTGRVGEEEGKATGRGGKGSRRKVGVGGR